MLVDDRNVAQDARRMAALAALAMALTPELIAQPILAAAAVGVQRPTGDECVPRRNDLTMGGQSGGHMRRLKTFTVASLIAVFSIAGAGTASAAAPNPPNCMGKDMGFWAREGSIAGVTGPATFDSGSGWGQFTAQNAQSEDPFGEDNWGHAMTAHLVGDFYGVPGVTCQPPG